MSQFKFTELRALGDFLELRHIRVTREQRRFVKNLLLTFMQTRHPAVTTYRIDMGDEAIGYVMLIHAENPIQWIIERLTIDQDHQRKGYGHAIVDQLIDMIHGFENSEMVIARFDPDNDTARRLFERLNFVQQEKMFRGRHIALLEFEFEEGEDDEDDEETDYEETDYEETDDEETDDEETDDEETDDEETDDEESDDEESDGKSVEPRASDDDDG